MGETTDYNYDRLDDLTQIKQYQGAQTVTTTKQYSERGLLVTEQPPMGQPLTYKYHPNGLPKEAKDASGKITAMEYYDDNKLEEKTTNQDRTQYYYHPHLLI